MQKIELLLNASLSSAPSKDLLNIGLQICDRLIDINEVMHILSVKRTTFFKGIKNGVFPEPIRFTKRVVRWRLSDVMAVVGQVKPFAPNMSAANDTDPVLLADSAPPSSARKSHQTPLLAKLEDRKRELLANAAPSKVRAQVPIKRRITNN